MIRFALLSLYKIPSLVYLIEFIEERVLKQRNGCLCIENDNFLLFLITDIEHIKVWIILLDLEYFQMFLYISLHRNLVQIQSLRFKLEHSVIWFRNFS